jgi:hypothetical protein
MRKRNVLILLLAVFSLQSCFDVIEKMTVNKNGTGIYELTYDLSSIMANGMMKEMLKESLSGEGEDNPFAGSMVNGSIEMDTLIALKDSPLASELKGEMPDVLEKVKMHMKMSESQGVFKTIMTLNFDQVSEIADFYTALQKTSEDGGQGLSGIMPMKGLFELNGKTLVRKPMDMAAIKKDMGDEDSMAMMRMMMADATYTTIYEFPKKVKSTNIKNAEVGKKTVKVSIDFLEIMDGNADMSGKIKFK